jgi:hypothetical protein
MRHLKVFDKTIHHSHYLQTIRANILKRIIYNLLIDMYCRSQCPCGLRRRSTAARLLGLWFEFRRRHGCLSVVSVVCCQVEVSATSWSFVQRSPIECGVSKKCDCEASKNEAA